MSLARRIQKDLSSLSSLKNIDNEIEVDIPKDLKFGDYTTNIALILAKKQLISGEKTPAEIGNIIKKEIEDKKNDYIEKVEVAAQGFVNFYISKRELSRQIEYLLKPPEKISKTGQTALVEYTDANPFKEIHIGHLYSNIVGESISRMLEFQGLEVKRISYQGDIGLHVAKAIYGMIKKLSGAKSASGGLKVALEELEKDNLEARMKFLGEAYAIGSRDFEENAEAKSEIVELNKKIYSRDPEIWELYEKGREWSLEKFDKIYERLGTKFDKLYFESEVADEGAQIVKNHIKDGIFTQSEGAIIFDAEPHGLHKRVFVNSLGLPTYEAKELGLALRKAKDFSFDLSIIVTAKEVADYFKVLFKAISLIEPQIASKMKHVGHGFVKLKEGKMSSRSGNVITAEWLLSEVVDRVKREFSDMDPEACEKVGVGAVKYSLLKSGIGRDVIFDIEESISLEGNSGPYLQYTNVRCLSVLKKFASNATAASKKINSFDPGNLSSEEDRLLRKIVKFNDRFFFTDDFSQHLLCTYLYELASDFNLFYQKCPIIGSKNEEFRLVLTKATSEVLSRGLYLLGIETPEKM